MNSETLSIQEAGRVLGVGRDVAYAAVRSGQIPSIRIGRRYLVPRQALEAMLKGQTQQPAA